MSSSSSKESDIGVTNKRTKNIKNCFLFSPTAEIATNGFDYVPIEFRYNEVDEFYNYCTKEKKMNIIGLMAIPPNDENTEKYFKSLSE